MTVRPGTSLLWLLASLSCASLIGFVQAKLLWLLVPPLLIAVVLSILEYRAIQLALTGLRLKRRLPGVVGRGLPFSVSIELSGSGDRGLRAQVRDEVPNEARPRLWVSEIVLPASQPVSIANTFSVPVRGRYQFGPAWVRLRGPLRLVEAQRTFASTDLIQVLPESLVSREELAKDAADELRLLDKLRNSRHHGAGTEFESLEDFRAGDDPRRIDWRATARMRRPVVRRFQIERHRDVMVVIDCGRLMGADAGQGTKLDCAVDAALRVIRVALAGGDRCGLGIFDDQVLGFMRPVGGKVAFPTLLTALYDVQSRWRETDFSPMFARLQARQAKRSLVIVLSDVIDAQTSGRYRTSLATLAARHTVLFAALRTPLLRQLVEAPVDTLTDGFKKAVVFRTLKEREQAIHSLRRGGVHVLDIEPDLLTVGLINQFVELRQSNLF